MRSSSRQQSKGRKNSRLDRRELSSSSMSSSTQIGELSRNNSDSASLSNDAKVERTKSFCANWDQLQSNSGKRLTLKNISNILMNSIWHVKNF